MPKKDAAKKEEQPRRRTTRRRKGEEEEEEEIEAEDEEGGGDIKSALSGAMREVKARQAGDPPIEAMVCQMGKLFGVLLGKKVGAGHAKVLKELLKGTGHKFAKGTCEWGKGDVYTFVMESPPSGAGQGVEGVFSKSTPATVTNCALGPAGSWKKISPKRRCQARHSEAGVTR